MGRILDLLNEQAKNGNTNAVAILNHCASVREKELVAKETPVAKQENQSTARMVSLLRKAEDTIKSLSNGRLSRELIVQLTEDSVLQGWKYDRLVKEVKKAIRKYEEDLRAESIKQRDVALGKIAAMRPTSDGGRFQRIIPQPTITKVGWKEDEIISYLCDPAKLGYIAGKLGWTKERCGKVSAYLRWRLNSEYSFGVRALSQNEIKQVRAAARAVLQLKP